MEKQSKENHITRRNFIKTTALLGGTAFFASTLPFARKEAYSKNLNSDFVYPYAEPENILYSVCLQCTVACSIKAKIDNGVLMKIDGNPYSAMTLGENLPYDLSPTDVSSIDGKVCLKGQAGIQHAYDPYRVRKVLKRNGPRGSGKWKTIPFDQAVDEIVKGGQIFADIGEDRHVEGLKDIFVLKDSKIAKEMADDVAKMRKKQMTVKEFQDKHRDHLHYLIDPNHPDKGPKNNQFLYQVGRIHNGRIEFTKRFVHDAFGSVNWIEKTSICGQTSNKVNIRSTMAYKDGKWTGGVKNPKPDHKNAEFLMIWGNIVMEAAYGPVQESEQITEGLASGHLKLAVVDPRLTKAAAKAWKWVPIKPGTDAALALGMIRWIIENERYDAKFLSSATQGAADLIGESTISNGTYLVKIENDDRATKHLRASEIGIGSDKEFVVLQNGVPVAIDPDSKTNLVYGDLFVDTTIDGIRVKSPLQLIKEEAYSRKIEEWAEIAGIAAKDIVELAREFTSHGKKAVVEYYRGVVKHTNGWYNAQAVIALNFLIGNPDWKGGLAKPGGAWDYMGNKEGQPYPMNDLHPNKLTKFGIPITKEGWQYEESTLFDEDGYPAKRPWYPFSGNVAQETWPAVNDEYPYAIKAALLSSHTPMYSIPGGQAQLKTLLDVKKVPLLICSDIVIGETSMYADYIFPDLTYLERWGTPQQSHFVRVDVGHVRQPVMAPLTETVKVFGEEMPVSLEALMMAIAERLGLSGFGKDAFGAGSHLNRMEDFYLKLVANIAYGNKPGDAVKNADQKELELFEKSRRHIPPTVFDIEKWKKALRPEEWSKVVYVLNRGGRFESSENTYSGSFMKKRLGGIMRLYVEEVAASKNAITGNNFYGYAKYLPIMDIAEKEINDEGNMHLITHKEVFTTQSRTISNYWGQLAVQPENYVVINRQDAIRLNLSNGDKVRVSSVSNPDGVHFLTLEKTRPVVGKVKIIEGIRPGVVAISTSYGHWAYGSSDVEIDGEIVKGDPRRGTGIHPNPLFRLDDNLRGTPMSDPIGGSASFYDTKVNITKV
ncbi:MAG: molybdopterin-dependent oxidoreductase [Tepidibacillus sp.]